MKECTADVKLLALDYDSTFQTGDPAVFAENIRAAKRFTEKGHLLAFITGRPLVDWRRAEEECGLKPDLLAVNNGATVIERNRVVFSASIPPRVCLSALCDVLPLCEQAVVYASTPAGEKASEKNAVLTEPALPFADITKVWFSFENRAKLAKARPKLEKLSVPVYMARHSIQLEFAAVGVTKATALSELARRAGVKKENVWAMGDNESDRPMLLAVPGGYAIGDCAESLSDLPKIPSVSALIDRILGG